MKTTARLLRSNVLVFASSALLWVAIVSVAIVAADCASPASAPPQLGPNLHLDGGTCPIGTALCGGRCVNLNSDNVNCGGCNTVCQQGDLCQKGICGGGGLGACPGMQTRCNGQCSDTSVDILNCGTCGVACAQNQTCMAGTCADASNCPMGQTSCAGNCKDLSSDATNCGSCGNACPQGQTCQASVCAAAQMGASGCAMLVSCLNNCMDSTCQKNCLAQATSMAKTLFNAVLSCLDMACPRTNGGVCDKTKMGFSQTACDACFNGAQMMGGKCSPQLTSCLNDKGGGGMCAQGQTSCGGVCTSTATDAANCGACGNACAQGQTCKAGVCGAACPQGQKSCNGVCTNVATDAANCGTCAHACLQGQVCQNGACAGGMGMTGCAGAVSCINNCNDSTCEKACLNNTTNKGITLLNTLFTCLDTACPSKNGGVCDSLAKNYKASACNSCYSAAQSNGGACVKQLNACTANGP